MRLRSLTRKLTLAYVLLILTVLGVSGAVLLNYLSEVFMAELTQDLTTRAALVRDAVLHSWPRRPGEGDVLAVRLAQVGRVRVTLILPDGTVVGESERPSTELENHADRPEFISALRGETGVSTRFSSTEQQRMLYVAVPQPLENGTGVIRVSVSAESVFARLASIRNGLLAALGTSLLLASGAGLLLGQKMLATPLARIMEATRQYIKGKLDYESRVETNDDWEELSASLNEMARSIRDQMNRLAYERNRVRSMLESLPDAVLLIRRRGTLVFANKYAREWLALPEEIARYEARQDASNTHGSRSSRNALSLIGRTPDVKAFVQLALKSAGDQRAEMVIARPAPIRVEARSYVLGSSTESSPRDGSDMHPHDSDVLIVIRDITELRRLEHARRDLVANASHELKTPIGAIRALAESLMVSPEDPDVVTDFLGRIVKQTEKLARLVDEMLYLARLESTTEGLALGSHDLRALAERALKDVTPLAESKGVAVVSSYLGNTNLTCDGTRVERAMTALLDNAIKFSPAGGRIRVVAKEHSDNPGQVQFEVTDEGPGIPSHQLPRVFERFYKIEESRTSKGSGLGLAIVKHVVEGHGGRAFAQSELGRGSTFGFMLPKTGPRIHAV